MANKTTNFIGQAKAHAPDMFWSNLSQGLITLSGLLISVVFVRFGSKELYGQYIFVLAVFGLLSIVSIPGVMTVIFRTIAQGYEGVYRKATAFSFFWSLLGVPLTATTGVLIYLFKSRILGISLVAGALLFPLVTSLQNWMVFLKGRSDFRKLAIYDSVKLSTNLIAVTASIVLTRNLVIIVVVHFLVESTFNIIYHFKSLSSLKDDKLDPGWKRQSYALTIMDLSSKVFGQVDIILIAALLPLNDVAIYALVMRFGSVFFRMIRATTDTVLPKLFKSKTVSIRYFYKFFLLSFLIPAILYPFVKYPIRLLYGQEYVELVAFTQVYLSIIPFYFLHLLAMSFMVKYHLNSEINLSKIIAIIAVISLYAILIPLYGIWGGIISSMLYFIVQLTINLLLLKIREPKRKQRSIVSDAIVYSQQFSKMGDVLEETAPKT